MTHKTWIHIAIFIAVSTAFCLSLVKGPSVASASPRLQASPAPSGTVVADATPQPTRTGATGEQNYVVEPGDSLWSIAAKFYGNGSKYTLIVSANSLPQNAVLHVGDTIVIPAEGESSTAPTNPVAATEAPSPTPAPTEPPTPLAQNQSIAGASQSAAATVPAPPTPAPKIIEPTISPVIPQIATALNLLSAICFVGSLFCAFLSLDAYRQSRRYAIRRRIGSRIRVKT